jgi:hypothetical protein
LAGSTSTDLHVYPEAQGVALAPSVAVDFTHPGLYNTPSSLNGKQVVLGAGTRVSSYLIHGDLPVGHPAARLMATIGFSTNIIGVQVLSATLTTNVDQLRVPGVAYATKFSGLELSPTGRGDWVRLINARTIEVSFAITGAIDDTRVITAGSGSTASALNGYRLVAADGGVFDFGGQQFYGSTGGHVLNQPIVSGVNTCGNAGYWFVARDGGIFSYGDATFHGSLGATPQTSPVVAMAATPTGGGYYLAEANGTVAGGSDRTHPFGDARLFTDGHGHTDASSYHLNQPLVGMATTPTGNGYWLLARDGGIFSYGDAAFYGSTGALHLVSPVIGFSPTRDGRGYWLFAADGGIFSFGDAAFHGSLGATAHPNPIVGMRVTATGNGYWLTDTAGKIYPFGDAAFAGDLATTHLFRPIIGMM